MTAGLPGGRRVMASSSMGILENMSWILNASKGVDPNVLSSFDRNRGLDDPAFFTFVVLYSVLICFGAAGNGLVVWAVARKRSMRTARNMFIVNLAVSDLLLCLVTMPLTLMEILCKYWPLGREEFICKILGALQAVSIFVSTISITAIALDRYQVIVYPTGNNIQKVGAIVISVMIWMVSLLLASPLFIFRRLEVHDVLDMQIAYCSEQWPIKEGGAYYSLFSLIFQYVFPIVIVTLAYSRICKKLRYRYVNSSASKRNAGLPVPMHPTSTSTTGLGCCAPPAPVKEQQSRPKPKDDRRIKRTNALFISIALIFGVSWLPLNIFNLTMDMSHLYLTSDEQDGVEGEARADRQPDSLFGGNRQAMVVTYALCHMMGMSSACTNPMLYGWLNENFRKEFREILDVVCALCCLSSPAAVGSAPGGGSVAGGGGATSNGSRRRGGGGLLAVPGREMTNGRDNMTTSLVHADETTTFTNVL
ncbi:Neuropeptide F receptor [Frankliniella fusca]|uniref:Neuropeptide F receptor n=1 Tax=Frankliniella fusca TaxID=407009 RepID=A0AAE1I486_9NEOP|nr:Neuropeptide F receptor [Frankliniella fusca]